MPAPSAEKTVRSRLLPQLSFRRGMLGVTIAVLIAWLGRLAWQGSVLPQVLLVMLGSLVLLQAIWSLLFLFAWVPAYVVLGNREEKLGENPFAADQLPPQILPPKSQ